MSRQKAVLIMAAGLGTRMRSDRVKVLHPVAGRAMILYSVQLAVELGAQRIVLVLGHQRAQVEAVVRAAFPSAPIEIAVQEEQLGTAHAVLAGRQALADFDGDLFILSGDVPALTLDVVQRLDTATAGGLVGVVGMRLDAPGAYGRMILDAEGRLGGIVEARDCDPKQLQIDVVNAGIYRVDCQWAFPVLAQLGTDNAQGEYYLTDLVEAAAQAGHPSYALVLEGAESTSALGVNDRIDLARTEEVVQRRLREALMRGGVTLIAPERIWLHFDVTVGRDTLIEPDVSLLAGTRVGSGCTIRQGCRLESTEIADHAVIRAYTHTQNAQLGEAVIVGPFARLREGTVLGPRVKLGNFVETKKARFDEGAKASHLSYIGDAHIGARANIGAGTITCNYDGKNKFHTHVGADAFIGSDSQLVAPVHIGDGAYVGAGTTVTETVPPGALALSRQRQRNIEGWVERKRAAAASKDKGLEDT